MGGLNLRLGFPCLLKKKIVDVTFFLALYFGLLATNHFASHPQQQPTTNNRIANMDVSKHAWNQLTDWKTG